MTKLKNPKKLSSTGTDLKKKTKKEKITTHVVWNNPKVTI